MNDSEQKPQKKSNKKSKTVKKKIKQEIVEEPKTKKVTLLVPEDVQEHESKKHPKQNKKNNEIKNSQNTEIKHKKKVNRNFISGEGNENDENCIQKPHNNKIIRKNQNIEPILFDFKNEDENQEKIEITTKKEKIKKNSSKKNVKNSKKKNHNLFLSKMRNIISKIESPEKIRKIFFYKWICFVFDVKYEDEEEEIENEEEEEEEEIEEEENEKKEKKNIANYNIPKTQYIVVHQENLNAEEQEEENEESNENNNENNNGYLEEIEERAPDEEESAICSVKNKKILMKFNNQIIGLRKIFKFKNILYYYFKKWKIITKSEKKIKSKKNIKSQKKNIDNKNNKNDLNNEDDQDAKKIKNNLKNFIELGGDSPKIQKKFFGLWKQNIDSPEIYEKKPGQEIIKSNTKLETETKPEIKKAKSSKSTKKKQLPKKIYSFDEGTNVNNSNQDESDISKSFDIINIKKTTIINKTPISESDNLKERKLSVKIPIKKNNNIDLKEKIDNICNKHKKNKTERLLSIDLPRNKKNSDLYNLDNRRSFSNLNSTMSDEETDNKLLNLLKIATCNKNPKMNSFDKWFDLTYNSKKYTPFIQKKSINKKKSAVLKSSKISIEEKKSEKKQKKQTKTKIINEKKEESKPKFGEAEVIKPKEKITEIVDSPLLFADDNKNKQNSKSATSIKKAKKIKNKKNKLNENNNKNNEENNNENEITLPISSSAILSTSPDLLFNSNNDVDYNKNIYGSQNIPMHSNNANVNTIPIKKTKHKKSKSKNEIPIEKNKNDSEIQKKNNLEIQNNNKQIFSDDIPRQKKPGGKVQFVNKENDEKKDTIFYENYGKDSSLDLKALENMVFDQDEELSEESPVQSPIKPKKKKHKKKQLSENNSENSLNTKEKKSNKNTVSKSVTNIKNDENENSENNEPILSKIHYFKEEINPDVENIEIYQDDEPEEKKTKKKHKKSKKNNENDNENPSAKKLKRAMHLLRKVIRSFKKRQKQLSTFNPDLELELFFKKWSKNIFKNLPKKNVVNTNDFITPNIIDNLQEEGSKEKSKKKSKKSKKSNKDRKSSEDKEVEKKNKILKIFDIVENHRKIYRARLSEDEENLNDKKWCWKKWCIDQSLNLEKEIKKSNNNMNIEENEEDDEENLNEIKNENENLQNVENEKQIEIIEEYINTEKNTTLPYIYNLNKIENKIKNNTINIMKKTPDDLYKNLCPEKFIEILKINNQRVNSYRIFSLYTLYNENALFYIMRKYFNIWRKNIVFTSSLNDKHIKCENNHCLICNCEESEIHCPGCSCSENTNCLNCECDKVQLNFKKLLIKHKFLKEMCPKKYYFNCWMKTKNEKK